MANGPSAGPGFDTDFTSDAEEGPIGPDGYYDVTPSGETGSGAAIPANRGVIAPDDTPGRGAGASALIRNEVYIGLALMALLSAALAWLFWRRRKQDRVVPEAEGQSLAFGVHKVIKQTVPSVSEKAAERDAAAARKDATEPAAEPAPASGLAPAPSIPPVAAAPIIPAPPAKASAKAAAANMPEREPARIDLALEIVGGTRSLMMFTADFRVEIANRADFAVRDLNISAHLACAQNGNPGDGALAADDQPIASLGRIGPHQSQRVSGQLQLPLSAVKSFRQGSKPLFIPMLHINVEGSGFAPIRRSFVIGSPSAASQTRVHPLPLDGPPGSLPSLRAQLIK